MIHYIETLKTYKTEREVDEHEESFSFREGYVKAINDSINLFNRVGTNEITTNGQILDLLKPFFIDAFINSNNEIILEPKNNIYFSLNDIKTKFDLDLKVIKWVSRPACKGLSNAWIKRIRTSFNSYFGRFFEQKEIERIYTKLGNGANPTLCCDFVKSNLDLSVLVE